MVCLEGGRTSKQKGPGVGLQTCALRGTRASEHDCLTRDWKEQTLCDYACQALGGHSR